MARTFMIYHNEIMGGRLLMYISVHGCCQWLGGEEL